MKIFDIKGKHVKTVPKRYERVQNLFAHFTDLDHKRLTKDERTNIEIALFIQELPPNDRKVIGDKRPTVGRHVIPREGDGYFSIVFDNMEFKCPKYIYDLMGRKVEIKRLF